VPRPRQYQQFVEPIRPPAAAPFPDLSWSPEFPDSGGPAKKVQTAALPFLAFVFALGQFPVPPLSWSPSYPHRIDAREAVVTYHPFFYDPSTPAGPVPALSWGPEYPDRLDRPTVPTAEQQAEFWVPGLGNLPIPPLSWEPEYPARLVRPTYPTADQQAEFWTAGLPNLPIPPLGWEPEYPVRIDGRQPIAAQQELFWSTFTPSPPAPVNPITVVYPDKIGRPTYPTVEQQAWFGAVGLPNFPIPPLSWEPEVPSALQPAWRSPAESAFFIPFVPAPPSVPILSFLASYPDRIPVRIPASDFGQVTFILVQPVLPAHLESTIAPAIVLDDSVAHAVSLPGVAARAVVLDDSAAPAVQIDGSEAPAVTLDGEPQSGAS
jgi:hypothetical protein